MSGSTSAATGSRNQQTASGLEPDVAATVAYVLGWLTGLVFFLVESDNEYVRFHAAQSIVVFGVLFLVSLLVTFVQGVLTSAMVAAGPAGMAAMGVVSAIFGLVGLAIWLVILATWVYLLVRTYQGSDPHVPVAAGIAANFT